MARERWQCRSGHDNSPGAVVCATCCAFAPGSPSTRLVRAAADFRALTVLYTVFVIVVALIVSYVLALGGTRCDEFGDCGPSLDGWTFLALAVVFVGIGMLLVLPLRAMTVVLMGVARLLTEVEADRG
jgi:hypothetical protein